MDGITDFDIKFKRSLIERFDEMNRHLANIVEQLETMNNLKEYGKKD